jgi:hypothetical protein
MTYQKTNNSQSPVISGFVAGTLVHTDKGFVPIEQLKVGDWVLSKHESGQGEQAYKRITKTFKSQEKLPVVVVPFGKSMASYDTMHLFCTANHPLWCPKRQQWLAAIDFKYGQQLIDLHGQTVDINDDVGYVMATGKAKIGICHAYYMDHRSNTGYGKMVDFAANKIRFVGGDEPLWGWVSDRYNWHTDEDTVLLPRYGRIKDFPQYSLARFYWRAYEDRYCGRHEFVYPGTPNPNFEGTFKAYVYNIEVEDFHTYYVGKTGICVASN